MNFTPKQVEMLSDQLDQRNVVQRTQAGRTLDYIEGWRAIAEANRIFGFDGWRSQTTMLNMVSERERKIGRDKSQRDGWGVSYVATVRITVGDIVREGTGAGHGIDADCGLAHESAIKEAETDARKRALMTFGNPFGLALYDKKREGVGTAEFADEQTVNDHAREHYAAPPDYHSMPSTPPPAPEPAPEPDPDRFPGDPAPEEPSRMKHITKPAEDPKVIAARKAEAARLEAQRKAEVSAESREHFNDKWREFWRQIQSHSRPLHHIEADIRTCNQTYLACVPSMSEKDRADVAAAKKALDAFLVKAKKRAEAAAEAGADPTTGEVAA